MQSKQEQAQMKKHERPDIPSSDEEEGDHHDEEVMAEKLAKLKNQGKKKMGISAECYGNYNQMADFKAPVIQKTPQQLEQIKSILGLSFMFNTLEEVDLKIVINAMAIKQFGEGQSVIKQGDDGAELFIVGEGALKCEKVFPGNSEPTFLKNYGKGDVFGELSLMYNAPRAASIISISSSVLYSLDRDTFNNIVKSAAIKRRDKYDNFLQKVEILSELEGYERAKIADCLQTEHYRNGDFIIREGEDGDKFYFLQEGTAEALKKDGNVDKRVLEYKENDYFGELALLNDGKRNASIKATSDKTTVAVMDKDTFKRILGPVENILKRNAQKYQKFVSQGN